MTDLDQTTAMDVDDEIPLKYPDASPDNTVLLPKDSLEWLIQMQTMPSHNDQIRGLARAMKFLDLVNDALEDLSDLSLVPTAERRDQSSEGNLRKQAVNVVGLYMDLVLDTCSETVLAWAEYHQPSLHEGRPSWLSATLAYHKDSPDVFGSLATPIPTFTREAFMNAVHQMVPAANFEDLLTKCLQHIDSVKPLPYPEALAADFSRPFIGSAAKELDRKILQVMSSVTQDKSCAPVLPILQSSGTGKSRAVTELSSYAPGISLCIRPSSSDSDRQVVSLPPQDGPIYVYLCSIGMDEWSRHCGIAALILSVLDVLLEVCNQYISTTPYSDTSDENAYWTGMVRHLSYAFADGIVEGYRSRSSSEEKRLQDMTGQPASVSSRKGYIEKIGAQAEAHRKRLQHHAAAYKGNDLLTVKKMAQALAVEIQAAMVSLSDIGSKKYFFLALDEFEQFKTLLPALRRLLSFPQIKLLCVLLLDTNYRIAGVTGPLAQLSSSRLKDGTLRLLLPHLIISQDSQLFEEKSQREYYGILNGTLSVDFKTLLSYLRRMGRPLWNDTTYCSEDPNTAYAGVGLEYVLAKLRPGKSCAAEITSEVLGLAACRLPLEIVGVQGSASSAGFLQAQIGLHLRCITGFELYGDVIYSAHPSEPLMSAAAALYQRGGAGGTQPQEFWSLAIEHIRKKQLAGVLNIGENGEEFIRIIMTMAMDFTAYDCRPPGIIKTTILNMINLGKWLRNMHGELNLPLEYQELVNGSWLNFTHFARLDEQYTKKKKKKLPRQGLVQAFTRQSALLGVVNQMLVDLIVIAYWSGDPNNPPRLDEVFEPWRVFPFACQIRYRSNSQEQFNHIKKKDLCAVVEKLKPSELKQTPPAPLNFGIFYNVSDTKRETSMYKSPGYLTIYVGGHHDDQYPILQRLGPSTAGDTLIGLLGPAAHRVIRDRSHAGSDAWRDSYFLRGGKLYILPKAPPV